MKNFIKNILRWMFIVLFIILFSGKLYSQIPVSIYTPHGFPVPNTVIKSEHSSTMITFWNQRYLRLYPDAMLLDSASNEYNCHAYAWHMFGNNNYLDRVWIGYNTVGSESIYWEDGSYDEVSEACATIVRYSWDHSAIILNLRYGPKYVSKWADGPLMMHDKDDCPFGGTPYKFYDRAIEANSGPELISALSVAQSCCRKIHILGSANFTISGLVTVPSCVTLVMHSGSNVTFSGGLTVNGNLETDGATLNFGNNTKLVSSGKLNCSNTTFTGSNWKGIELNGSGSNGSKFYGCTISQVNNSSFALSFNNNFGSTVSYCTISDLPSGTSAIYAYNSNIAVYKNKIQNNSIGVRGSNNTQIRFGSIGLQLDCNSGNNTIKGNTSGGIDAQYSTYFDLSILVPEYSHMNNISGNTNFNARAKNGSYIDARRNYWGGNPAPGIDDVSSIDASGVSACIPPLPFKIGVIEEDNSIVSTSELKKVVFNNVSSDISEELRRARGLAYSEYYNEAMAIYKSILSANRNNEYTSQALNGVLYIYRITHDKELLEYLRGYSRKEANPFANIAYANALITGSYVEEALLEYAETAKNNPKSIHAIQALIQQSYIYYFDKNDMKRANELLVELKKIAEEDDVDVKQLKVVITNDIKYEENEGFVDNNDEEKETEVKVSGYSLNNYPNPFNPTTNIQFTIPKDEHVKLTVYDITGRVVKELVNGYKTAGKYSIEFNANNYASGTYYYRLEAGEYKNIQKMMLVK